MRIILQTAVSAMVVAAASCSTQAPTNDALSGSVSAEDDLPSGWFSTWGTSIYTAFPHGPLSVNGNTLNTGVFTDNQAVDQSFRMMIHPTASGDRVRFRFDNTFGDRPLMIENASVAVRALPTGPSIMPGTSTAIAFDGHSHVTIPVGGQVLSDPVDFPYAFGDTLAVSFFVPGPSGPMSWHAEAFASQYISFPNSGDVTADALGLQFLNIERGWFFLSGMDSQIVPDDAQEEMEPPFSIVAFGDSITDGFLGTPELNHRWPDFLARRLQALAVPAGVVNVGITANTVLENDDSAASGEAGIERFQRDVINRQDVRAVLVLLGTNDISLGFSAEDIYAGLVDIAEQAHAAGLCLVVSTILPRNDPEALFGWNQAVYEPIREQLNDLILGSDAFISTDALSQALESPLFLGTPNNLLFVEGLHPNSLGMKALADAIPLELLLPPPHGQCVVGAPGG